MDDALALAVLFGSPELRLLGATTVYGDTRLRARVLTRFAGLAGREVPCVAGARRPLSGAEVWLSGQEGALWEALGTTTVCVPDDVPAPDDPEDAAAAWLCALAAQHAGELEVVAIGPMTNLARALRLDPEFAGRVARVWVMGGRYDGEAADVFTEHNVRSDEPAWREVVGSDLPLTLVGLDITQQVRIPADDVAGFAAWGPLGAQLERETVAWMAYWDEPYDVPHDATTVVRAVRPDLFSEATAGSEVARRATTAQGVDAPAVLAEILDRLRAGCRGRDAQGRRAQGRKLSR